MAELSCTQEGDIDLIRLTGVIDTETLMVLRQTISTLRQQGCKKIVWLGNDIQIPADARLELLEGSWRIFRNMGGKIALAEFSEPHLRILERTSWHKYLNIFKTGMEAKAFLDPQSKG